MIDTHSSIFCKRTDSLETMKIFVILIVSAVLAEGSPLKPSTATLSDNSESFPWMKASKAKGKPTPSPKVQQTTEAQVPQTPPLVLTSKQLQDYLVGIAADLQPYVVPESPAKYPPAEPMAQGNDYASGGYGPPPKKSWKSKVPKDIKPVDLPATTLSYWDAEKKLYPDSFYDDFFMDWLRKRQVEDPVDAPSTPSPVIEEIPVETTTQQAQQPAVPTAQPYPSVPMSLNPYLVNPYLYPLAGMKLSKTMVQAQVNAALTAMNITTTAKPVKIKLKIPIPAGSDLATVVSSGIAGFPTGTTYELSRK